MGELKWEEAVKQIADELVQAGILGAEDAYSLVYDGLSFYWSTDEHIQDRGREHEQITWKAYRLADRIIRGRDRFGRDTRWQTGEEEKVSELQSKLLAASTLLSKGEG